MDHIVYERRGPLAWLTINRPPMNPLGEHTWGELGEALDQAAGDKDARVVVLTGAGDRAFSAGADLKAVPAPKTVMETYADARALQQIVSRFDWFPKPIIAAINGYAIGGGCLLAAACTFRIASDRAQFGLPEINLGIVPGLGACQRLVRLIGLPKATEMVILGDRINAEEALRIGLVNRVVPGPELASSAQRLGEALAEKSPAVLSLTLAALRANQEASAQTADLLDSAMFTISTQTEEAQEARQRSRPKAP